MDLNPLIWLAVALISFCSSVIALQAEDTSGPAIINIPESESCVMICGKTYSLHTYPKADHFNACDRGCRFYTLIDLLADGQSTNSTRNSCLSACAEAYNDTQFYACSIGCNNQVPQKRQLGRNEPHLTGYNSPSSMMRSFLGAILRHGQVLVQRSSFSFYYQRNSDGDSNLVVVQSEPEVVVHQYPDLTSNIDSDDLEFGTAQERTTTDYKSRLYYDHGDSNSRYRQNTWINCFGYNSGVPRWLLASVTFLAIFVLAWICCVTTVTAPDHHVRREVGVGSDLQYLRLLNDPVKIVMNEKPPSYEEVEAGPLPQKQDI